MYHVLGIESSCDETAASVIAFADDAQPTVLSNIVYTQHKEHLDYGGVVPEIAARAHVDKIEPIVSEALKEAGVKLTDIDGFAATCGPGLLGGLLVGVSYAKTLASTMGKPYIGVNHLEGHALTCRLTNNVPFPYLLLLVSGGHCQFIHVSGVGEYETIGGTLDDAVGEAFDKVAKLLKLGYPGGPAVEKLAEKGNPKAFKLPIPLKNKGIDFSFSGLKTATRQLIQEQGDHMSQQTLADLCASFQETVAQTLEVKTKRALQQLKQTKHFVLSGGVAANKILCGRLKKVCAAENIEFTAPPTPLCTDNGVMIAYAGGVRLLAGESHPLDSNATPRLPLETMNKPDNKEIK